jgi:predicted Holliday junction resolvase-like endonuclease
MEICLGVLFILLVISGIAIVILALRYHSLKSRIDQELRKQTEVAYGKAQEWLKQWREQELERVRQEQLAIARSEMQVQFEQWKLEYEEQIRQDAIQRSQSVTIGKVTEHIVPYFPDFTYNPKDARFIGRPVDLIIFDGLSDGEIREIIFAEIKTGKSALTSRERQIRDVIKERRVDWVEIRPALMYGNSFNDTVQE